MCMDGYVLSLFIIFNEIDLKRGNGFLLKKMTNVFFDTGHGMTDIIDTEFKFQTASNYELN